MKGIYKKLSVGVLAAVLLAGGSGLVQGGQAFAANRVKLLGREKWQVQNYVNGWLYWVRQEDHKKELEKEKQSNLDYLKYCKSEFKYEVQLMDKGSSKVDGYYRDARDFISYLFDHRDRGEVLKGEYEVQIGLDAFKIIFN